MITNILYSKQMTTMLSGGAVIDAALLLIAGSESYPQPQTSKIVKLEHVNFVQNKVDLVKEKAAHEQHENILVFVKGTYCLYFRSA